MIVAFDNYTYQYNGLGDRVQQTVNGVTTTYVLDLNAGLTQVLSDGTDTYLYGLSRIGEESAAWDYYLGDALGSVRQLTDGGGAVSLAQAYQPYGELMSAYGDGVSSYSFTGEALDASGLIFLRARYFAPGLGRFISRDTWGGIYEDPLSLNRWMYTMGNPVNFTDPSGHMPYTPPIPWPTPCGSGNCLSLLLSYFPSTLQEIVGSNICSEAPGSYINNQDSYTLLDISLLTTTPRGGTGETGIQLYNWYIDLWRQPNGWWWTVFGEDGEFSVLDAIAIGLLGEGKNVWEDSDHFFEAEVRELYQECSGGSGGPCTLESIVNFAANHYESVGNRLDNPSPPEQYTWPSNVSAVNKMINFFENPMPDWMTGRNYVKPYGSAAQLYITLPKPNGYGYSSHEWNKIKDLYGDRFYYLEKKNYIPSGCSEGLLDQGVLADGAGIKKWEACPIVNQ